MIYLAGKMMACIGFREIPAAVAGICDFGEHWPPATLHEDRLQAVMTGGMQLHGISSNQPIVWLATVGTQALRGERSPRAHGGDHLDIAQQVWLAKPSSQQLSSGSATGLHDSSCGRALFPSLAMASCDHPHGQNAPRWAKGKNWRAIDTQTFC